MRSIKAVFVLGLLGLLSLSALPVVNFIGQQVSVQELFVDGGGKVNGGG